MKRKVARYSNCQVDNWVKLTKAAFLQTLQFDVQIKHRSVYMNSLTNYISECSWEDILITLFVLVDDVCQELNMCLVPNRKHTPGGSPTFSDSEVITIVIGPKNWTTC